MQFLGLASVIAILVVAGVGAASTLKNDRTSETTSTGTVVGDAARQAAPSTAKVSDPAAPVQQQAISATPAPEPVAPADTAPPTKAPARGGFVVVEGRTKLTDSIYAMRTGDSVVVNFDAYGYRTRRSTKLEQSLRTTLPLVFGKMATASIDTLAPGALVTNRDVVGALAGDGMRVKLDNGAIAHIRVLTRIVSDGPIAIGYLTTIER